MSEPRDFPRVPTGTPGLDHIMRGGIPRGCVCLVEGRPGSGKTTLSLQFLLQGARDGHRSLLVSNAESPTQLKAIAASHGWNLDDISMMDWEEPTADGDFAEGEYTLFPEAEVEVGESLQSLFAEVERVQPAFLVIDTISALRALAPTPAFYRRQLRRIRDFLAARDCTTFIVDDASEGEKDIRNQTLADGILELSQYYVRFGGERRLLRVRKLRGSRYIGGAHDFTIETGVLEVYPRLIAHEHTNAANFEPAESGLAELDALTGGGLPRGTSTLFMGPAGSGKSTLGTIYAKAAAKRGERCVILLFDEHPESYIARSKGLGVDIAADVQEDRLHIVHLDPAERTPGQIAHFLIRKVEEDDVGLVVIDTLNGYLQSALEEPTIFLHLRELISYLARRGVVTMLTLTQHGVLGTEISSPIDLSFLADNVFLLRYFEAAGDVRKAISVVKKRTGQHERTIRELRFAPGRLSLSEPLTEFTGVLTGVPVYSKYSETGSGDDR